MADDEEKPHAATAKKRAEARKKGQVLRSHEFSGAVALLAITVALHFTLPGIGGQSLVGDMQSAFRFNPSQEQFGFDTVMRWQMLGLLWAARLVLPVMLLALVLGLGVGIGQVGFQIVPEALAPKWDRLNPANGVKRLLSTQGAVELGKGLVKMLIIGGISYTTLRDALSSGELIETIRMPLSSTLGMVGGLIWTLGLRIAITLFILAVADYIWQKHQYEKNLRMTATEYKQEMKQTEGDPKIKGRIRRLQREMSRRRMMQNVPKADVIVTNPTHYAIALQYEHGSAAPKVIAKGQDEIARRIKEIALENRIPLVENKPLARTLYATVALDSYIPPDLYEAVAQILAFVYRTYGRRRQPVTS
jgi:flagellar biosynthetic protein FlhB